MLVFYLLFFAFLSLFWEQSELHATPTLQIAPVAVLASEQPGSVTENRRTVGSKVATAPLSAYIAMTPLGLAPKELPTCPDCAEKQFTC